MSQFYAPELSHSFVFKYFNVYVKMAYLPIPKTYSTTVVKTVCVVVRHRVRERCANYVLVQDSSSHDEKRESHLSENGVCMVRECKSVRIESLRDVSDGQGMQCREETFVG